MAAQPPTRPAPWNCQEPGPPEAPAHHATRRQAYAAVLIPSEAAASLAQTNSLGSHDSKMSSRSHAEPGLSHSRFWMQRPPFPLKGHKESFKARRRLGGGVLGHRLALPPALPGSDCPGALGPLGECWAGALTLATRLPLCSTGQAPPGPRSLQEPGLGAASRRLPPSPPPWLTLAPALL